jgi:putative DNA primase/helicase
MEPLADSGDGWDANPDLFAVKNGVLDLRTSELLITSPDQKITKITNVPYISDAPAPRWLRFLIEIFNNDLELIHYIQLAVGLSLTGHTFEQVLFICYGRGGNGKSKLLALLRLICGDYAFNAPFSTFELYQRQGIPQDLAVLEGHRLITASETTENARLNEGRLKALTGEDAMTARYLFGREFTFIPIGKIWLAVNHRPRVKDDSFGFWRRVRMIPFTQKFDPQTEPDLEKTLRGEAPGILAWAVRGAKKWYETGLGTPPAAVMAARREYQEDQDPIAEWLNSHCVQGEDYQVSAQRVFEDYQTWAEGVKLSNKETLSRTMFGRTMTERFDKKRKETGIFYYGLDLRNLLNQ